MQDAIDQNIADTGDTKNSRHSNSTNATSHSVPKQSSTSSHAAAPSQSSPQSSMSEHQDDPSKGKADTVAITEPSQLPRKNKGGRPSIYTPELAAEICRRIAGGQHVVSFNRDPDMPDTTTFYDWVWKKPDFAEMVTKAREAAAEALVDETVAIADDTSNDTITIETRAGNIYQRVNREWVDRSKVRVGVRQWLAAKWNAKRYGDKTQIEQTITVELGSRLDSALKFRAADQVQTAQGFSLAQSSDARDTMVIDVSPVTAGSAETMTEPSR